MELKVSSFLLKRMKRNTDFKRNFIDVTLARVCVSREFSFAVLVQGISLRKYFWVANNGQDPVQERL